MMAKHLNILLLLFFVVSAIFEVSVIDAAEIKRHHIEENHQELAQNAEHDQHIDFHCANHSLHHGIAPIISDIDLYEKSASVFFICDAKAMGVCPTPATPPPLSILS